MYHMFVASRSMASAIDSTGTSSLSRKSVLKLFGIKHVEPEKPKVEPKKKEKKVKKVVTKET